MMSAGSRAELGGYCAQAVRRPLWWLNLVIAWQDARRTVASARHPAPD